MMNNPNNFMVVQNSTDESQLLGKFLYYSLADVLVKKEDFERICHALDFPYAGRRISVVDAFKNATGNRANQNDKALVVNSFYVADDEKQREKMASEFYTLVRKEAQEYQERAAYLIDSGCQSASIMERWIRRIHALEQKKQRYEALFRKELSETDAEFGSLALYSQELQVRAEGIRMMKAA